MTNWAGFLKPPTQARTPKRSSPSTPQATSSTSWPRTPAKAAYTAPAATGSPNSTAPDTNMTPWATLSTANCPTAKANCSNTTPKTNSSAPNCTNPTVKYSNGNTPTTPSAAESARNGSTKAACTAPTPNARYSSGTAADLSKNIITKAPTPISTPTKTATNPWRMCS